MSEYLQQAKEKKALFFSLTLKRGFRITRREIWKFSQIWGAEEDDDDDDDGECFHLAVEIVNLRDTSFITNII